MQKRNEWIDALDGSDKPINNLFLLLLKCPEHAIPDDENSGIVFVQVFGVGAVMNPVMRRGIHQPFDRTREFPDALRMQDGLIELHDHLCKQNDNGIEPEQHEWQVEKHGPEGVHWTKSVGYRNVEEGR